MFLVIFCVTPRRNPRKWIFEITESAQVGWLLKSSFGTTEMPPDPRYDLGKHSSDGQQSSGVSDMDVITNKPDKYGTGEVSGS